MNCSVADCARKAEARGWCKKHWRRWRTNGDPLKVRERPKGTGTINPQGYLIFNLRGHPTGAHILIAAKAFGRPLPSGVVVHHANGVESDNRNENLVICTQPYHMLLHRRMRARDACGHAHWRRCPICKAYDAPENLYINGKMARHRLCHAKAEKERKAAA